MLTNLLSSTNTDNATITTIPSVNQLYKLSQSQAVAYLDNRAHKYLTFARRVRSVNLALASCAMLYANWFKQLSRRIASMNRIEYSDFRYDWRMQQQSRAFAITEQSKRNARKTAKRASRKVRVTRNRSVNGATIQTTLF